MEVPIIAMLLDETGGYRMGRTGKRDFKRTHTLFIDDLKVYQESHKKLEVMHGIIVKASMDTGACYGKKKCTEVIFNNGELVKREGLNVLEERMIALDPEKNEAYKLLGCEQGTDKTDVKKVTKRKKKEV